MTLSFSNNNSDIVSASASQSGSLHFAQNEVSPENSSVVSPQKISESCSFSIENSLVGPLIHPLNTHPMITRAKMALSNLGSNLLSFSLILNQPPINRHCPSLSGKLLCSMSMMP